MKGCSRRSLLLGAGWLAGSGAGIALAGTRAVGATLLRPPGARDEPEFLAACLRCGQCAEACPHDALRWFDDAPGNAKFGTPHVEARTRPCTLCLDLPAAPCIEACPSGALEPVSHMTDARMGTAEIDESTCLAYNGTTCRACWHACPFPGQAIGFDERLRAIVQPEYCTGCGLCVRACLTDPESIRVRPRGAMGRSA